MEGAALGRKGRILRLLGAGLVAALVPVAVPDRPAHAGPGTKTFVSMISSAGGYIGGGTNRFYHPGNVAPDPSRPAPNDPGPNADVHARSLKLREGARKLAGRVTVADGAAGCYANVLVLLQRRRDGEFRTIARIVTDDEGRFKKRVRARRSLYRALAPREAGPNGSVCGRAVSRKVWF